MPYDKIQDLPDSVKNVLPHHAQEIYLSAYNNAHFQYYKKQNRRDPTDSLEEICHKVAWASVKEKHHKTQTGKWSEKI